MGLQVLAISASGPLVAPLLWWIDSVVQPETSVLVYVAGLFLSVTGQSHDAYIVPSLPRLTLPVSKTAMGGPAQTAMLADLVTPAER